MGGKSRLLLIEINGQKIKPHGRALLHVKQKIEHCVAVFAA